ncbi:ThiF family adenylyltransferase [Agromyces sp. Marseille-P2726]|uniref:ThiF family adenylyltransferase n=1 Tax=Agromyces sp. Marseille-P2726 TaxID=2709132 RepID=UPI00156D42BD|nr:ThiF family adenylyltransferase [Agromyces sp. Marseille-P2726]
MAPIDPDSPRYARQRVLPGWGPDAQRRLAEARVVVLGAGGLGSFVVPALVAAGVGTLVLVDDDDVDLTNLHRQTIHMPADIGRPKVDSAADAAAALSPDTDVVTLARRVHAPNAADILAGAELIVDGTDDLSTTYAADAAASRLGIPLVWGSAARFSGQVGVAWDAHGISYRDLFPEPPADGGLSCEIDGIMPTVCTVTGGLMAGEALKLLTGVGEPLLGRVAVFDGLTGRTREIVYRRAETGVGLETRPATPGAPRPAEAATPGAPRPAGPATPGAPRPAGAAAPAPRPAGAATPGAPRPAAVARPTRSRDMSAEEVAAELERDDAPLLLDVREPWEAEIASIPGSTLIPLGELGARAVELRGAASVIAYCHHGVRSARALDLLDAAGISNARHLAGGIEAWSRTVDPNVARY